MEQVTWPDGIPVSASQDGFKLIVDKLVADSIRLEPLFRKSDEEDEDEEDEVLDENVVFLTHRAYLRYESLCSQELRISRKFCEIPVPEIYTKIAEYGRRWITNSDWIRNARNLADLGNSWTFATPGCISLKPFLVDRHDSLHGRMTSRTVLSKMSIIELRTLDFRNTWIDMYEMARDVDGSDLKPEWVLLLTTLAFRGVDVHQLMLLHCVAVQRVFFQAQEPPQVAKFINPSKYTFDETEVLGTMHLPSRTFEAINQASVLVLLLKTLWPIDSCTSDTFEKLRRNCVNVQFSDLNAKLKNWNTNRKFVEFLAKVEATTSILPGSVPLVYSELARANFILLIKTYISSKLALTDFSDMLKEPKIDVDTINLFNNKNTGSRYTSYEGAALYAFLRDQKLAIDKRVEETYQWIKECFVFPETELLYQSDLVKLTPTLLLRRLLDSTKADQNVHSLIGALGVLWTLQQRVNRCLLYFSMAGAGKVQLYREQENPGHENWVPADHPEWLLFEIEMNLMIRSVQIDVARQMISPPLARGKKHAVMQLNMGEGKTAVIVPLLALSLANGDQLCRVTVLKSLFTTNFASLVNNLGGLLNRRVYIFPCRRDMPIDEEAADIMLKLYKECQEQEGVVLTLPEYRLSFQLKGYEKSRANMKLDAELRAKELKDARSIVGVQKWLADNVRDVLDESDEILHAKYQLIYTLGSQISLDGGFAGELRWSVAQCLLKLIPARAVELQAEFGTECVDAITVDMEPEIFHHIRLLGKECYQELIDRLADDILDGKSPGIKLPVLDKRNQELVRDLLTKTDIDEDRHIEALRLFESVQKETILILMGYLKYEILYLVLSKRWRVNYGVDKDGDRKMAIPFRAKDLPAKRTEFGHPDVAIMLTQLSYYYSGLSNEELEECFVRLNMVQNKEREFASWMNQIPVARNIDPSIRDFNSLNLTDFTQKNEILFPALRRNRLVVDFWLSQTVFPKESRAFEKKLVCTAWDLCPKSFKNPVTGFSGTNDSTVLLPLPVSQQDLPTLQNTNENLRKTILLPENNNYRVLHRGTSGIDILKSLVADGIPILLDSGALMLELSNEKVAEEWLRLHKKPNGYTYKAAVYFDEDHNLRVKDINHLDESSPYDLSPFREQMDQCVVYLDDAHTRGTDLKIPPPSKACVTLCTGMTRDKMVQACMRMRLLGRGHTISFYSSDEADNAIKPCATSSIGSHDVVEWIFENNDRGINARSNSSEELLNLKSTVLGMETSFAEVPQGLVQEEVEILRILLDGNISILFDAGGLMSKLSNEEVATQWLNNCESDKWKGVVYFDDNHVLTLKQPDSDGFGWNPVEDIAFCKSQYADKPEMCLFYVDRAHTRRGGHMIQPTNGKKTCVTVCAGFRKEKLLQCSLLLGNSSSILFFASNEAVLEIKAFLPDHLGSRHVMQWVCENSRKFEQDGLVYWSGSGLNYAHKQAVEDIFYRTSGSDSDYENLGGRCCDQDFLTLNQMYGEYRQDLLYTDVLNSHIEKKKSQILHQLSTVDQPHWLQVNQKFDSICVEIMAKCSSKIGHKRVLGQLLDEEHEKENEEEAEEEQEVFRPPPRTPADHILSPDVITFMETGLALAGLLSGDIQHLHSALKRTTVFWSDTWGNGTSVYATRDFVNVIKSSNTEDNEDEFLRTPNWVGSSAWGTVLLSPFEANYFIPKIRAKKSVASIRMFAPRLVPRQSVLINSSKLTLSPCSIGTNPIPDQLLAPLYLFSATLYFKNESEQNAFCYFTGILPREWTEAEQEAFDAGKIDTRGFILEEYRQEVSPKHAEFCKFNRNPEELVRGIIKARHGVVPESCHVAKVVLDCRKVPNYEN